MTASEVLRKARALIEKPENWTRGAYGRNEHGRFTELRFSCSRCSAGAVLSVCEEVKLAQEDRALNLLREQTPGYSEHWIHDPLVRFNDTHAHAEVLSLFDRAIAAAEARGE